MRGILWTWSIKGLETKKKKKSLTAQMKTKYFDREKGLVCNWKLNFEEKKKNGGKKREKAKAMPLLL